MGFWSDHALVHLGRIWSEWRKTKTWLPSYTQSGVPAAYSVSLTPCKTIIYICQHCILAVNVDIQGRVPSKFWAATHEVCSQNCKTNETTNRLGNLRASMEIGTSTNDPKMTVYGIRSNNITWLTENRKFWIRRMIIYFYKWFSNCQFAKWLRSTHILRCRGHWNGTMTSIWRFQAWFWVRLLFKTIAPIQSTNVKLCYSKLMKLARCPP